MTTLTTRVIRSREEIEDIRDTWTSWQRHPNADIDFYLTVQSLRPTIVRPHVIVVHNDGRPEAMLVGRIEHRNLECSIGYKRIFSPAARVLRFVYGGQFGNLSEETAQVVVKEVVDSLGRGEADVASFYLVKWDSPLCFVARSIPGLLSRDYLQAPQKHWSMTLGSTEEWQLGVSRKVRKNQRWKKLVRDYPDRIRIDSLREPGDLGRMIPDMEEIAKKTYQRGLGAGFIDDAVSRQRLRFEAEKGWLRIYILYLADRPCAFWSGTCYGDTFFSGDMGYDSADSQYSPGMFLIMKVIEGFRSYEGNQGISRIDWGFGDAEYKQDLSDEKWYESSVSIWAPTPTGLKLNLEKTVTGLIDRTAKVVLQQTTLIQTAKRRWRDRLRQVGSGKQATEGQASPKKRAMHQPPCGRHSVQQP
jgi:hypothetical protein